MHPKDAEGMANSVEPLTLIRLLRDYTVCPDTKDHYSKKKLSGITSQEKTCLRGFCDQVRLKLACSAT